MKTISFLLSTCFLLLGAAAGAQVPLGEQVQQDRSQVRADREKLRNDEAEQQSKEQSTQQYIQQTEQWIQQSDAQRQQQQAKLNELESGIKSKATLSQMLKTPGTELYVLNTWLNNNAAQRAQAESNLSRAQQLLSSQDSVLQQDRQAIVSDQATVQHDAGMYRSEMDSHADLFRQAQNARYMGDFQGVRRGRFYTQNDQSRYDAGVNNNGGQFWGMRRRGESYSGAGN